MSRSYKKTPIIKDNGKSNKKDKRLANKKVRRYLDDDEHIIRHKSYRKVYNSWDIADYICRWTEEEARKWYQQEKEDGSILVEDYKNEEDFINHNWKRVIRK